MRAPAVYIMASRRNGTLYTGVTADLSRRAHQHREGAIAGFTRRYGCKLLVWYERYDLITDAIAREEQIKGGSRAKKLALIETINPQWRDLYVELNMRGAVIASAAKQPRGRLHSSPANAPSRTGH